MADAIDIAAQQFVERNPEVFGNVLLGGRQFNPKMDFSKGLMTKKLYNELTGLVSRFSRDSISPEDQKKLDKYFPNLTKEQIIGDSIASKKAFADIKPPTESTEKAESPSTPPVSTAQPAKPTGSTGQQGTAGAGSGSMGRSSTPAGTSTALDSSGNVVSTAPKLAFDNKGQLVSTRPLMVGSMEASPSPATSRSDSRKSALDRARDILKGDTYQLGSSSILTAAREMRKPTPFRQRTDEQVAARNLVVRDRMAREQGKTYNPKATALDKAKSRMRDLATSQEGAKQFFADTGVSPKGVRAISGERMPERRRTYEAPRNPNVVRTETPSERFEGRTNVSYRSFSPDEVNELEKRRRNR
jgi:hypothetical protein